MIEKAGWLLLDLADYLRMSQKRSLTVVGKQECKSLKSKIARQIRQQERAGDPLAIVKNIHNLMGNSENKTG